MPSPAHAVAPSVGAVLNLGRPYRLHPKVALRPERFGALAYSYETRRLSLLKDLDLVAVVRGLAASPSAAQAMRVVPDRKRAAVEKALARLVEIGFVEERSGSDRSGGDAAAIETSAIETSAGDPGMPERGLS